MAFLLHAIFILVSCNPAPTKTDDLSETATCNISVFTPDDTKVETLVSFSNGQETYQGNSEEDIIVPAPGEYVVKIGSPSEGTSSDGLPIVDGQWIYPEVDLAVEPDELVEDLLVLNPYIYGVGVECELNGSDGYSELYHEEVIETSYGYKLKLPHVIGEGSWFAFAGNQVTFEGAMPENGTILKSFELFESSFTFILEGGGLVDTFECSW